MPSVVEIGLTVLEKKIFEGFLPYIDVATILVIVTKIFQCHYLRRLDIKFQLDRSSVFREEDI